ncbi:unnamed protein product [Leptidea sinapis]|uniref:Uncharacterized protein n=1 Tax=Leptidea sinapis TaxID=189913 RepID=A0A5E4QC09_9NEOP|nr:unnamed protein product [Leptidea sinapis]
MQHCVVDNVPESRSISRRVATHRLVTHSRATRRLVTLHHKLATQPRKPATPRGRILLRSRGSSRAAATAARAMAR